MKRLPPWPGEPQWMRTAWASNNARLLWEPRIAAVNEVIRKIEIESVFHGTRTSALLFLSPQELIDLSKRAAKEGLALIPHALESVSDTGYSSQSTAYDGKGKFQFRSALTSGDPAHWVDASEDDTGRLLGYPTCCTAFFKRVWVDEKWRDTTWPMFENGGSAGPAEANILLRWLGIRLVRHLPCSFGCAGSALVGQQTVELGNKLGFTHEMQWAREMLSWPIRWSSLHGIAEIKTPVLKISASTDPLAEEAVVEREATGEFPYPEQGVPGLGFPFEKPTFLKIQHSRSFKRAFDTWTENGFSSKEGMEAEHNRVLRAAERLKGHGIRSVVDLGCGNGLLLEKLRNKLELTEVHGVESDPQRAKNAYVRLVSGFIASGNIADTSLWDKSYDLVVLMPGRLEEMSKEDADRVIAHASRSKYIMLYAYAPATGWDAFNATHVELISVEGIRVWQKSTVSSYKCSAKCCSELELNGGLGPIPLEKWKNEAEARLAAGKPKPYDYDVVTLVPRLQTVKEGPTQNSGWVYRCGHLTNDGLCSIYDKRPRLCREYPATNSNGGKCKSCGFKSTQEVL